MNADSPPPAPTATAMPPSDAAPAVVCGESALCLTIDPIKAGTTPIPGKLMVVWKQLDADGADPAPEIGFQTTFAGTETEIVIPLAQITPPTERNFLCERTCSDESACPCTGEPKVGTGFVFVYSDANQDGQITVDYAKKLSEPLVAVGQVLLAYSDAAVSPPPTQPGFWKKVFPSGIEQGVRPYSLIKDGYGFYQRFGAGVAAGTVFPLKTCDAAKANDCDPPIPNPM